MKIKKTRFRAKFKNILKGRRFIVKNFWISNLCERVAIYRNF